MITRIILIIFIISCLSNNSINNDIRQSHIFKGAKDASILYPYVKSGLIKATVKIDKKSNDTLINLKYKKPLLDVRVDSVYFFYVNKNIFKCLLRTPLGKGLIYIEQNDKGEYKDYRNFGGWIKSVYVREAIDKGNKTILTVDILSLASPFNYNGTCIFSSNNHNISFTVNCTE